MPEKPSRRQERSGFGRLRKRDSGRWAAAYTHAAQLWRAPATFPTKGAAAAWLGEERRLIDLGIWTPPGERHAQATAKDIPFREYTKTWLAQRPLASRTRALYESQLRCHVLPVLGDTALSDLTPPRIRAWYADLGTAHPTRNAQTYALLRTILNTAVEDKLIETNPCKIKAASVKRAARSVVLLDPAELATLADAMPDELSLTVLLAGWCALRRGELFALTRGDISAEAERIEVTKALSYRDKEFTVGPPKTVESRRTVTVPVHLRPAVLEHLDAHTGPTAEALLFPDPDGGPMREWAYRKVFNAAKAAIDRPALHFHDLRHLGGVLAAQTGATTREVMARLGHTSPSTAMRYQHVAAGREDVLAQRLSALAAPPADTTDEH